MGDRYGCNKDLRPIIAAAREQSWTVEQRKSSGHILFLSPDKDVPPIFCAQTFSDFRGIRNLVAMLKKHGLEV